MIILNCNFNIFKLKTCYALYFIIWSLVLIVLIGFEVYSLIQNTLMVDRSKINQNKDLLSFFVNIRTEVFKVCCLLKYVIHNEKVAN